MKFHRTLVKAVVDTLQQIFAEGMYADKAVELVLKQNPRWGARDRRFIAETTYEMVRWWRKLAKALSDKETVFVDDYYKLFAVLQIIKNVELPDWEEFADVNKEQVLEKLNAISSERKWQQSIPDWLDEIAVKELGVAVWEKELPELNKEALVVLRVNTLKISTDGLRKRLQDHGIETELVENQFPSWKTNGSEGLIVKRQSLANLDEYKQGLFEIQDASSQLVAPYLQLKAGFTVIDACAGAGGKSLHIAAMMKNKGRVISMDVEPRKLEELKRRADRAGVSIIQSRLINNATIKQLENTADRLLLDVPCSGLGVIKRNADAKWKLSAEFIEEIKKVQQHIITDYSRMLKPGGIMVYATCSILPGENQDQVEKFLKENQSFELIEDRKVMPSEGFDGFYMAAIKKNT